ncbi:hypothetical protein TSUD_243530 [Trifolium subterraneum]|uniref:Uncharacterized protein n=1 Tax=Trifolium subterraneum TaxID=3900 RepID=A0A2Z6PBI6_TRISU|nr:hypothetical protein TSUD_243530 [Trifolium subterraneum]
MRIVNILRLYNLVQAKEESSVEGWQCVARDNVIALCFLEIEGWWRRMCLTGDKSLPPSTGELQRTECLRSLGEISVTLAERPARGDLTGEMKESLQKLVKHLKGSERNYGAFKIDMAHFGNYKDYPPYLYKPAARIVKIAIIGILGACFGLDFLTTQGVVFLELPQCPLPNSDASGSVTS